jgi:glucose-6-phosphate 1-epimerase
LEGYAVHDKITDEQYKLGGDPVVIDKLTDRVYTPPTGKDVVDVTFGVGAGKTMKMTATGLVDGLKVPVSCVVWNPFKENAAAMGDFGSDQYVDMICVEPGILGNPVLEGGKSAELIQVMEMQ